MNDAPLTNEQIEALSLQERLAYAQSIREHILANKPITPAHIRSGIYAMNLAQAQVAKPKTRGANLPDPKPEPTVDDLMV